MARRNKLKKFAEVLSFPNVYENFDIEKGELIGIGGKTFELKGKWCSDHFKNDHPLVLELACGRGEYTNGLAAMYPNQNYIGVDIKGARIWRGAKNAIEQNLPNAAYLRTRIEKIASFFGKEEIDEIWITFPDPFLKKPNRRLTSMTFLPEYQKILKPNGLIHLKTDSTELYEFTMEEVLPNQNIVKLLYHDDDIYNKPLPLPELDFKTYYERMHLANEKTIKYIRMQLNA